MGLLLDERDHAPAFPVAGDVSETPDVIRAEKRVHRLYAESWPLRWSRLVSRLQDPAPALALRWRARRGLEDRTRLAERLGFASAPRPKVPVVWIHAADAEAVAGANAIIGALANRAVTLVTTSTVPAAFLATRRLPDSAIHQYCPIDHPQATRRFLDHWRPDLALWADSPLALNLLCETARRGIPLALVNGRMPEAIYMQWRRRRWRIAPALQLFSFVAAQSQREAARYRVLCGKHVHWFGDIRHATRAPVVDDIAAARLKRQIGRRPLWAAVNTLPGEEGAAVAAHRRLLDSQDDSLLILCPRQGYRGIELEAQLAAQGFRTARRNAGGVIDAGTQILIFDGPADAALAYHLSPVAFIGGSIVAEGGHNPLEAAHLQCAIIAGPHMEDYVEAMAELRTAGAVQVVTDAASLCGAVRKLISDQSLTRQRARIAAGVAAQEWMSLTRLIQALEPLLPENPRAEPVCRS